MSRCKNIQTRFHPPWRIGFVAALILMTVTVPPALVASGFEQGPSSSAMLTLATASESETQPPQLSAVDSLGDPLPEGARLRLGTLRFHHPSSVVELALSPDEKSIVTIGSEELIVWDAANGKERWRAKVREQGIHLSAASYGIQALAFAPDSSSFCTPGGRNEVIVWQVASGRHEVMPCKEVLPASGLRDPVKAVNVSKDGKKVAVGSSDGVVVWGGKDQAILAIANKPAGDVPIDRMNKDRLWFGGHYSFGTFSPDGKMVAVVTSDAPEAIRLFDSDSGQEIRRITLKSALVRLAFSPDSTRIATTERDVAVRLYETNSGRQIWSREIEPAKNAESYTSAIAYSPDAKIIAVGAPIGPDNSICLLEAETGNIVGKLSGHTWKPWTLAFSADSKMLYSSGWDGVIRRWDVATHKQLALPGGVRATSVCTASPDGHLLAYADDLGTIYVVDTKKGVNQRTFESSGMEPSQLTFSSDSRRLAAGGTSGDKVQIMLWNVANGELLRRWDWPKGRDPHSTVESLSITPNGERLAAAVFRQSAAYIWDVTNDRQIARLQHPEIYGLSFSPDGKTLATAGWDKIIRFWDTDNGKAGKEVRVTETAEISDDLRMYTVCYAPTGGLIATAHLDGTVSVWQADTMALRQRFKLDNRFIYGSISFSPDGLWLAAGEMNGRVSLWDPSTARLVAEIGKHQHYVYTLGFGSDYQTLLTGGEDGVCYLWDLRPRSSSPEKDPVRLWDDLVGADGAAAYRAMWTLFDMPERAVKLFTENTREWERISADKSTDQQAMAARRVVSVLVQVGTTDARQLLKKWATENPNGILGLNAAEALKRASSP